MTDACTPKGLIGGLQQLFDAAKGKDSSEWVAKNMGDDALSGYLRSQYISSNALEKQLRGEGNNSDGWLKSKAKGFYNENEALFKYLNPVTYRRPSNVVGEAWKPLSDAGIRWNELVYDSGAQKDRQTQKELWKQEVVPEAEALKDQIEMGIIPLSNGKRQYALRALDDIIKGRDFEDKKKNLLEFAQGNASRHLLANNPVLTGINYLETWRAAAEHGQIASAKGWRELVKNSPKNPLKALGYEIPDLQKKGIYSKPHDAQFHGLMGISDNALKAHAYYTAKAAGLSDNDAVRSAQKLSFQFPPTDMPEFARSGHEGVLWLARFGLEQNKFIAGEGILKLFKDPKKGAVVLATLAASQSFWTGQRSVLGPMFAGVLQAISPDLSDTYVEGMNWLEEESPVAPVSNVIGKYLGVDLAHYGGIAGLPLFALQSMVQTGFNQGKKLKSAYENGDNDKLIEAAMDLAAQALVLGSFKSLGVGPVNLDKLGDINAQRALKVIKEVRRGDTESEDFMKRWFEKTVPLMPGRALTPQGEEDIEKRRARHAGYY